MYPDVVARAQHGAHCSFKVPTLIDRVSKSKSHHASWIHQDGVDEGLWNPLKIIEHLKNPVTELAVLPVADGGGHYFGTVLRAPEELDNIIADSCVSAM